jgi:hypothetical protein
MKRILALVLLAVLGFAVAACGSTKKAYVNMGGLGGPAFVARGTTTISDVTTGDLVRCKGGPSATVPTPGGAGRSRHGSAQSDRNAILNVLSGGDSAHASPERIGHSHLHAAEVGRRRSTDA